MFPCDLGTGIPPAAWIQEEIQISISMSQARPKRTPMNAPFESEARKRGESRLANQLDKHEAEKKRVCRVEGTS